MYNWQMGHACTYRGGKGSDGNPGINHEPPFLGSIFSFKYVLPERENTSERVKCPVQEKPPSPASPSIPPPPGALDAEGWGGGQMSPHWFCLLHIPHPPRFSLGFSKTFDPEKRIGSRFGKAETNQLPFEGVESDKKSEGMPGLTDPKPPRCSDGLKDEQ